MASSCSYVGDNSYSMTLLEETWFQGNTISNIFFGIQSTLCAMAFFAVFQRKALQGRRVRTVLLVYIAALFVITTAAQGFLAALVQMAFVKRRDYPGGPSVFLGNACHIPANLASNILVVFANWMMESLLVWRCHVVCSAGDKFWWLGIAIPSLMLIVVLITGSLFIYHIIMATPPMGYVLAYAISSLVLNFAASGFIAGRLLYHRHRVVTQFGRGHGHRYVSIAAVVIESAAIYTSFLLVVIVAYATGSPATNSLQQMVEQVQSIASLLTILRIARGEGWTTSTDPELILWGSSQKGPNVIQLNVLAPPDEEAGSKNDSEEGNLENKEGMS